MAQKKKKRENQSIQINDRGLLKAVRSHNQNLLDVFNLTGPKKKPKKKK